MLEVDRDFSEVTGVESDEQVGIWFFGEFEGVPDGESGGEPFGDIEGGCVWFKRFQGQKGANLLRAPNKLFGLAVDFLDSGGGFFGISEKESDTVFLGVKANIGVRGQKGFDLFLFEVGVGVLLWGELVKKLKFTLKVFLPFLFFL